MKVYSQIPDLETLDQTKVEPVKFYDFKKKKGW